MVGSEVSAQVPGFVAGLVLGISLVYLFLRRRRTADDADTDADVDKVQTTFDVIKSRRTITPKDFNGGKLDRRELDLILEAANWAPTHKKTEPWRFSIYSGNIAILDYLDFIENYYRDRSDEIPGKEIDGFNNKLTGIRRDWPEKVSHLLVIGMKRGEGLPEWEEICAVAMAVQNMHLMTAAMEDVGGFWSSHTWCRRARDSPEFRRFVGFDDATASEDRIFGAFVLGKVDPKKRSAFRSTREDIQKKLVWEH